MEGYLIAGLIVIICIFVIIFALRALHEARSMQHKINDDDDHNDDDDTSFKSKRF